MKVLITANSPLLIDWHFSLAEKLLLRTIYLAEMTTFVHLSGLTNSLTEKIHISQLINLQFVSNVYKSIKCLSKLTIVRLGLIKTLLSSEIRLDR